MIFVSQNTITQLNGVCCIKLLNINLQNDFEFFCPALNIKCMYNVHRVVHYKIPFSITIYILTTTIYSFRQFSSWYLSDVCCPNNFGQNHD